MNEELLELLEDLEHDLGKYLRLPFSMLSSGADDAQLREALERSLLRTRGAGGCYTPAAQIWSEARAALCVTLASGQTLPPRYGHLTSAVDRALAWRDALQGRRGLDRVACMVLVGRGIHEGSR